MLFRRVASLTSEFCLLLIEFKIYCELNLPQCVTYVLPPIINRQARTSLRFLFDRLGEISSNSTQLQEFLTNLSFESLLPRSRRSYLIPQSELQSLTPARINIDDLPDVPSHWLFSASTVRWSFLPDMSDLTHRFLCIHREYLSYCEEKDCRMIICSC